MSYERALNEIASLLTQQGTPPGHSQDIAQRLTTALSSYFDYRMGLGSDSRTIDSTAANNSSFQNKFKTKEQVGKRGLNGQAGVDGIAGQDGWGFGVDGAAGQDGQDGQQGEAGQSGRDGRDGTSVGLKLQKEIDDLKKRVDKLEKNTNLGKLQCPTGKFAGSASICDILEQQAKELEFLRKCTGCRKGPDGNPNPAPNPDPNPDGCDCDALEQRIKDIEDLIDAAVECS